MISEKIKRLIDGNTLLFLSICYIVIVLGRIVLTLSIVHPQSLPDESEYDYIARLFINGLIFNSDVYPSQYPPAYPILLIASHIITENAVIAYHISLALNCIISSLIIFPAWAILKRFTSGLYPVFGAVLVALLPSITASNLILMSENLFTLLVVVSVWAFIRAESTDSCRYDVITGFVIALAFLTRATGVALIIGYIAAMIIILAVNRNSPEIRRLSLKKVAGLLTLVITYGIWVVINIIFKGGVPHGYGLSVSTVFSTISGNYLTFLHTCILEIQYLVIGSFTVFFIFALFWLYKSMKKAPEAEGTAIFVAISSIVLFVVGVLFVFTIIQNDTAYMYGRYLDPILPLLIIFGTIGMYDYLSLKREISKKILYPALLLIFIAGMLVSINSLLEPNNNAVVFFWYSLLSPISWIIMAAVPVILILVFYRLSVNRQMSLFFVGCIILSLLITVPIAAWEINASHSYEPVLEWSNSINEKTGDDTVIWEANVTNPHDRIWYSALRFWMNERLINVDNLQERNLSDGWLITRNFYQYNKILLFRDYILYKII